MIRTSLIFASLAIAFPLNPSLTHAQQPLPAEGDETQLLSVLESDAGLFDKAKACQRLAIIGSDSADSNVCWSIVPVSSIRRST